MCVEAECLEDTAQMSQDEWKILAPLRRRHKGLNPVLAELSPDYKGLWLLDNEGQVLSFSVHTVGTPQLFIITLRTQK